MNQLTIASGGTAHLPICIAEQADIAVQTASKELSHFLRRITGAEFSVRTTDDNPAIRIAVDPSLSEEMIPE